MARIEHKSLLSHATAATVHRQLTQWYRVNKRDLPWRQTRDPYRIWVSEIMLQQTQVDTVKPRYDTFLKRFPSVEVLADATEEQVCEAWAGLGYYRRARNLHRAATQIRQLGAFPLDVKELEGLAGIGRYTAGAIASIAFKKRAPLVDGNVIRVLTRLAAAGGDPAKSPLKPQLWATAQALVDPAELDPAQVADPGDLNQGLMELGAMICSPKNPSCSICPVRSSCGAFAGGEVEGYPQLAKAKAKKKLEIAFLWNHSDEGLLLSQRSTDGLWAGLWELPSFEGNEASGRLKEAVGKPVVALAEVRHTLTHRLVTATVWGIEGPVSWPAGRRWMNPLEAPLSGLARKAILAVQAHPKS